MTTQTDLEKSGRESHAHIDNLTAAHTDFTSETLTPEHHDYLLARHGRIDLTPLPSASPADPFNWPTSKKVTNLVLVAIHAMMATFTAACIIPAFQYIAADLDVSIQRASYLTSLQIAVLGGAPLIWRPISIRYGRRPIFLLSLLIAMVGNIGCAVSKSYGAMAACRAIVAFFICPAAAIGTGVVRETFFTHQRARYIGVWTLCVTLGVPLAPFIFGFVAARVSYRWIFWILAIINAVQLLLYSVLGPETRYIPASATNPKSQLWSFGRIDPTRLRIYDFIEPLRFFGSLSVFTAAVSYSTVFLTTSVLVTVELPQLFGEKFDFGPQPLGLQFLALVIGSLIGELLAGNVSDAFMTRAQRRAEKSIKETDQISIQRISPSHRLWLSYPGFLLSVIGIVVFLVQTGNITRYNVSPIVGAAIGAAGNQLVTTVLITYAVDTYPDDAASVGVFITFVRQTWGFIGPFWFPEMFAIGLKASAAICAVMIIVGSILPVLVIHWRGR